MQRECLGARLQVWTVHGLCLYNNIIIVMECQILYSSSPKLPGKEQLWVILYMCVCTHHLDVGNVDDCISG